MFKLALRDLFWLTLVAALGVMLWQERCKEATERLEVKDILFLKHETSFPGNPGFLSAYIERIDRDGTIVFAGECELRHNERRRITKLQGKVPSRCVKDRKVLRSDVIDLQIEER